MVMLASICGIWIDTNLELLNGRIFSKILGMPNAAALQVLTVQVLQPMKTC